MIGSLINEIIQGLYLLGRKVLPIRCDEGASIWFSFLIGINISSIKALIFILTERAIGIELSLNENVYRIALFMSMIISACYSLFVLGKNKEKLIELSVLQINKSIRVSIIFVVFSLLGLFMSFYLSIPI